MDYEQILSWQRGTMVEQIAADIVSQINNRNLSKMADPPMIRRIGHSLLRVTQLVE
jgi:hypothetical protein